MKERRSGVSAGRYHGNSSGFVVIKIAAEKRVAYPLIAALVKQLGGKMLINRRMMAVGSNRLFFRAEG